MSGSRRNRILNLNTSFQSNTVSNHHVARSSHQQAATAFTSHQQPPAVNNPNAIAGSAAPRPMVIQYAANPYYPPPEYPSVPVPAQTRPQYPSQGPDPTRILLPPSPIIPRTSPNTDFAVDRLSHTLVAAMTPILSDQEKSLAGEIKKIEGSVEKFVIDAKEARTETNKRLFQLAEAMQKSVQMQQAHTKDTNKRIEKIEALIMACFDRNDEASLISRLENIQYTVGELSERVKDPGAPDFFVAPQSAQTENDTEARALPTPPESIEERVPGPVQRIYDDKSTSCDVLEPLPERAPSLVRPIYTDAASDAMSLEPECPPMASSIRPEYKSVGNDTQTLSPPRLQRTLSDSSLEYAESNDLVNFVGHRKKASEVSTFDGGSRDRTKNPVDVTCDFVDSESPEEEGPSDVSIVIDIDTSVDVDSPVESEPELNEMSTDNEGYDDTQMGDEHQSDSSAPAPIGIRTSASPEENQLVDGSVAALPQTVLSTLSETSMATPSHSQEQRSLPSPATTPSAPASPERELSPDAVPVATLPQLQRPVYAISSPTSSSNPEREASSPRPNDTEPMSGPVPMPPTPVSAPLPKIDVSPASDDGSELSVSRIVTAQTSDQPEVLTFSSLVTLAPEHIEETQAQASPPSSPLFLPESRSQSPPPPFDDVQFETFLESPPPSPKPHPRTPSKLQSVHLTTPVAHQTSPAKAPSTIFNSPLHKLRKRNSDQTIISIKSTPQKTPTITRQVHVRTASPRPKTINPIMIHSSPIFVPSRSSSPLSPIGSDAISDGDSGSDSELDVIMVKKKEPKTPKKSLSAKVETKRKASANASMSTSTSTSTSGSIGPAGSSSGTGTGPRHIDLFKKLQAKKGESAALTRVRKRKAPTAEQMEPPLKRARQKASVFAAEVEREVRVKRETPSVGAPIASGHVSGRGKGKGKEREREDEKGYKLPNNIKVKVSPVKEKTLRPRAPPPGVKWPQKNMSGDKKFDNQFIECERCYTWYHYGCIGIMDLRDPIIKGDRVFLCPPCAGGGANPMLPSNNIVCGRPDCEKEKKRDDEYFMTAIIGRYTKVSGGTGRKYMWLVKWDGYPVTDCTWEEEEGMSDPHSFIQDFDQKATREGKDPDEDPHSTILLNEAIRGGWADPNA